MHHPRSCIRPIPRRELDGEAEKDISINGTAARTAHRTRWPAGMKRDLDNHDPAAGLNRSDSSMLREAASVGGIFDAYVVCWHRSDVNILMNVRFAPQAVIP
jgi:hypothetical protein